jgi:hypothetical protein
MLGKADARGLELRSVPGVDEVEREAAAADLLDAQRHLGEHHRVVEVGLDRGDDLDALGQRRQRRGGRPGFELLAFAIVRVDGVLGHQDRIEAQRLGRLHQRAVARPSAQIPKRGEGSAGAPLMAWARRRTCPHLSKGLQIKMSPALSARGIRPASK